MRPSNLSSRLEVAMSDIHFRVIGSVFHLYGESHAELLQVDLIPINADAVADNRGLVRRKLLRFRHVVPLLPSSTQVVSTYICSNLDSNMCRFHCMQADRNGDGLTWEAEEGVR